MNYVYVTPNTEEDKFVMAGYRGTSLLATRDDYLVWLWEKPRGQDLAAVQADSDPSVRTIAMSMINVI